MIFSLEYSGSSESRNNCGTNLPTFRKFQFWENMFSKSEYHKTFFQKKKNLSENPMKLVKKKKDIFQFKSFGLRSKKPLQAWKNSDFQDFFPTVSWPLPSCSQARAWRSQHNQGCHTDSWQSICCWRWCPLQPDNPSVHARRVSATDPENGWHRKMLYKYVAEQINE